MIWTPNKDIKVYIMYTDVYCVFLGDGKKYWCNNTQDLARKQGHLIATVELAQWLD